MDPIFLSKSPRLLSHYSQDPDLINAYKNGKDLYATIGIGVYKNKYEDNLEHHADGSINVEGKKRRSNMKKLLLGEYLLGPSKIAWTLLLSGVLNFKLI